LIRTHLIVLSALKQHRTKVKQKNYFRQAYASDLMGKNPQSRSMTEAGIRSWQFAGRAQTEFNGVRLDANSGVNTAGPIAQTNTLR